VPFCTWLLMGYFSRWPGRLEEAALVDGCNRVHGAHRVVLPSACRPWWWERSLVHPCLERVSVAYVFTQHQQPVDHAGVTHECNVFSGGVNGSTTPPPGINVSIFQRWVVKGLTRGPSKDSGENGMLTRRDVSEANQDGAALATTAPVAGAPGPRGAPRDDVWTRAPGPKVDKLLKEQCYAYAKQAGSGETS